VARPGSGRDEDDETAHIDDFVACAHYLIDNHFTATPHLAIEGTSAGGIAVGGFLTQHPELVERCCTGGITDILRSEQRSTGAQNAYEYGSVKIELSLRDVTPSARMRMCGAATNTLRDAGDGRERSARDELDADKMTARCRRRTRRRTDFAAGRFRCWTRHRVGPHPGTPAQGR